VPNYISRLRIRQEAKILTTGGWMAPGKPLVLRSVAWTKVDLHISKLHARANVTGRGRRIIALHSKSATIPLRGDVNIADVEYEMIDSLNRKHDGTPSSQGNAFGYLVDRAQRRFPSRLPAAAD
jgi:hypothetical protein